MTVLGAGLVVNTHPTTKAARGGGGATVGGNNYQGGEGVAAGG